LRLHRQHQRVCVCPQRQNSFPRQCIPVTQRHCEEASKVLLRWPCLQGCLSMPLHPHLRQLRGHLSCWNQVREGLNAHGLKGSRRAMSSRASITWLNTFGNTQRRRIVQFVSIGDVSNARADLLVVPTLRSQTPPSEPTTPVTADSMHSNQPPRSFWPPTPTIAGVSGHNVVSAHRDLRTRRGSAPGTTEVRVRSVSHCPPC
jgi:hypothetical protein